MERTDVEKLADELRRVLRRQDRQHEKMEQLTRRVAVLEKRLLDRPVIDDPLGYLLPKEGA